MQLGVGDAVVLDVIFPAIFAVGDPRQQLVAEDGGAFVENGLEAGLDLGAAEPLEQRGHALRPHQAGLHLAVEVGGEHVGNAGVALDDGEDRLVAHALGVELHRRDGEPFLEHRDRRARHRARHAPADVVMVSERLDVGDDLAVMEHRHRAAEVRQMADAALGEIGVVHQEHVAGTHGLGGKIAHHGIRHRRIGAAGELAAVAVEQADAVVVGLADHRAAGGALDRVFDLGLDRVERAFDDLQHDRVDRRVVAPLRRRPRLRRSGLLLNIHHVALGAFADRTTRMPCGSTSASWPGNTTVVDPNSSITAGPASRNPAGNAARS